VAGCLPDQRCWAVLDGTLPTRLLLSTNLTTLQTTAFLPLLQKATEAQHGWSSTVVNISSISGHVRISQDHFSYNASKGATIHLNKMLATEIAKNGIKVRVNSIAPGVFPSEMTTQESRDDNQKSEMPKEKKEGLPSQRPGKDTDMAAAILFATCCQYLNGQVSAKYNRTRDAYTNVHADCYRRRRIFHSGGQLSRMQASA
jgi:NAD(P)-dependent dehydrogenase (short-subunit alcohol dehydrogenase family)